MKAGVSGFAGNGHDGGDTTKGWPEAVIKAFYCKLPSK